MASKNVNKKHMLYAVFRDFSGFWYYSPVPPIDMPGRLVFHSKGLAKRYCKIKNAKRLDSIERIENLRKFIALGRTACRLLRSHYRKYVNDFDKFCKDYDYSFKPATL